MPQTPIAERVRTSITGFNKNLSSADTNVQLALDTLDNKDIVSSIAVSGESTLTGAVVFIPGTNISLTQSGQTVTIIGTVSTAAAGVNSIAVSGESTLGGDIVFIGGSNMTLSQSGQTITFVSSTGTNAGVLSIAASGESTLVGDIIFVGGANISLTQSGQSVTIAATVPDTGVTSVVVSGESTLTGAVTFIGGSNMTLSQSGQTITFISTDETHVDTIAVSGESTLTGGITFVPGANVGLVQSGQSITVSATMVAETGVASVAVSGETGLAGDVVFIGGSNMALTQSGQTVTFLATTTSNIRSIAVSGEATLMSDVIFITGSNITLTQSGQGITIAATTGPRANLTVAAAPLTMTGGTGAVCSAANIVFNWDADSFTTSGNNLIINYATNKIARIDEDEIVTGNWDFGGAATLEIPNAASPSLTATGQIALDLTDKSLVIHDGTSAKIFAHPVYPLYFSIASGGSWDTQTIPIAAFAKDMAITIQQVDVTVIGSTGALTFNLEERPWASYNTAGTVITTGAFVATAAGLSVATISNSGIATRASLVFVTTAGAATGTVDYVLGTVYYTKDIE